MGSIQLEKEVRRISTMDRERLVRFIQNLQCDFPLDFTDDFLKGVSLERLRHIATAAVLHAHNQAGSPPSA